MPTREIGPIVSNVVQPLTDGSTIEVDASQAFAFSVTLGGDRTIANPTSLVAGSLYILQIKQDGTGSRLLSWGSAWKFPEGTPTVLSTGANATDVLTFYNDGTSMYLVSAAKNQSAYLVPPSSLVASDDVVGQINLTWDDNSSDETGFEIIRSDDIFGVYSTIHTTAANVESYSDATVDPDVPYYYKVRARRGDDASAYSLVTDGTAPSA